MAEGSGGPWTSSGAQVSAQPGESTHIGSDRAAGDAPPSTFPIEQAERGIQLVSRFAGPAIFFLTLGGIVWLLIK